VLDYARIKVHSLTHTAFGVSAFHTKQDDKDLFIVTDKPIMY